MSTGRVFSAVQVVKTYGFGETSVRALGQVSVGFESGRFTAIKGPSGSGKSTLMHCLAGLDTITSGQIWVGGTELSTLSDRDLTRPRRDRIGFIFQAFNLVPHLSALKNITLPLALTGRPHGPGLMDHLVGVPGIGGRLSHGSAELSGGQQQRVAIVRGLISRPAVVFADEPTGNLDSRSSDEVLSLLQSLTMDRGQTTVMVTHDGATAACAHRAVLLSDNRVVNDIPAPSVASVVAAMAGLRGASSPR
ncbi:ABC transporter ATP-binding protein [Kineosporia mesophila]|uniref:ABC transporter ATP-binding protein n=1 Tax=Kineosporia mesophila TaxID=566012 RepID=UPI001E405120|nr:ABC transporter ATP-binding protein [Kineosporia mesophila]